MFTSYKKHTNKLYNKLVELSRNKFFYSDIKLADNFETRALLIFFHFIIILRLKKDNKLKKIFQDIFDNIFQNIEINIKVNKTIPSYATTIPKPQAILIVSISLTPRAMKSPTVFFSYDSFGSF